MNIQIEEKNPEIPTEIAILPLFNTIVYPSTVSPLAVGLPESVQLIDDALAGERIVGMFTLKNDAERPHPITPEDFYHVGTAAIAHTLMKLPDGTLRVAVQGLQRIEIEEITQTEPYFKARIRVVPDVIHDDDAVKIEALMRSINELTAKIAPLVPQFPEELMTAIRREEHPRRLAYMVASYVRMGVEKRQEVLTVTSVAEKLQMLHEALSHEVHVLEVSQHIQSQVQDELGKNQREYLLREQLKTIQKELGENNEQLVEAERLATAIEAAGMSIEAHQQAMRELERLRTMPPSAAEYGVIRSYLETLIELPWQKASDDQINLEQARDILDEDHYNLDEIKERILDFLAVRELRRQRSPDEDPGRGAILCFVGPPGVGKTSLGRSIARAMNREFVRISLGGVRDEAEIRGHRRTYIGAMPGSLMQAMRRVGVNNPVFMLDEIDKLGSDYHGDPTSAMLEVLDPEQNDSFRDHYLDVGWDLSKVMFIATANTLQTIPAPLRDRMEIIQLSGYTMREKMAIAERYLVPEQIAKHGLHADEVMVQSEALAVAIEEYTREAGVRNLEQQVATLMRKAIRKLASQDTSPIEIDADTARTMLGKRRFYSEVHERTERPGVVTGLVWTPVGGDIIFIEATKMLGKGAFLLTGQLGDVMQESARAAMSWVRAEGAAYGIDPRFYSQYDVHVHVPAGAQPKDGPSAGISMTTALVSLLSGRRVRDDLAMTGEMTLRGKVLPVGGIKEKVLAAHRAGIRTIIVSERNRLDLDDLPLDLRNDIEWVFADTIHDVLQAALYHHQTEPAVQFDESLQYELTPQPSQERLPREVQVFAE